jgi:hypothetical protein
MTRLFLFVFLALLFSTGTNAQRSTRVISGLVTSQEERTALPGALVYVKGTKNASGTQQDGVYYIEVSPGDSVLVFCYDEYQTKEIRLTAANEYNVVLCKGKTKENMTGALSYKRITYEN